MKKPLFFLIFFLLVFSNFTFYINAEDPPVGPAVSPFIYFYPPENSFGMSSYQYINWSYFDNCFLYETTGSELEVEWNKSSDTFSKFKYKFKTDVYGLYFLNISFTDNNLNNVSFDIENFTFELVYLDGSMFFNFTDIMISTDFEYDYVLNAYGFKLILYNYLDVGEFELDPTFGYTGESLFVGILVGGSEYMRSCWASPVSTGEVHNITIKTHESVSGFSCNLSCALYEYDDYTTDYMGALLGTTETKLVDFSIADHEVTFEFSSPICVDSADNYYLATGVVDDVSGDLYIKKDTDSGYAVYHSNAGGVTWDDPYTGETASSNKIYIYATYTVGCAGVCVDECYINESSESPVNGTTGITTSYVNSSVIVNSSCGIIDWVNISVNGVGFQNFTSPANGTFWYNNTAVFCKQQYIWWCNTSCNGSLNSSWFSYTVNLNCCPFVNNSVPANGSSGVSTSTQYWYVDSYDQNNEKTDGTIVCTNGDSGSWSQKLNGTRSLKLDAGLDGGENYTVWVNITDGECSNNYTFWFETAGWYNRCPDLDQIPIANESEGVYIDIDWWNMTVYDPDGNTTNGTIWLYSVENPSYYTNMSWFNQANGTQSLDLRNYTFSYDTNYTVNITITDGQCVRNRTYWFITQNAPFGNITWDAIEAWLQENGYIKESDSVEIELTSSFLGVFITLVLFILFFIVGYTENKRSGGAFFMLSGFLLLSLEYLVATSLNNISIALLSPFAIFIIVLGIRKWLYPAGKEKTKTEGQ